MPSQTRRTSERLAISERIIKKTFAIQKICLIGAITLFHLDRTMCNIFEDLQQAHPLVC